MMASLNLVSGFLDEGGDDDEEWLGSCLLLLPRRLIKIMSSDMYALHTAVRFTISTFQKNTCSMFIPRYLQGVFESNPKAFLCRTSLNRVPPLCLIKIMGSDTAV